MPSPVSTCVHEITEINYSSSKDFDWSFATKGVFELSTAA